jgi:glycine cleavage system H protein
MAAGMVAYKLCDRGFDCENCPLDAALRGDVPPRPDQQTHGPDGAELLEFPVDRRFHPSHTWAMAVDDRTVRCGVDMFAAQLLPRVRSVVLPARSTRVHKGRVGFWVVDDGELIPLRAPVSGRVTTRNPALRGEPGLLAVSPYDDGWLLEIRCYQGLKQLDGLMGPEQIRARAGEQRRELDKQATSHGNKARDRVGATLPDGGQRLTDLREILGPDRYRRLIVKILG